MIGYIARRLLQAVPTLIGVTILSFLIVHAVPGGPAQAMLGPRSTPLRIAAVNREFGLNKPLPVQYGIWFWQLVHLNLGTSYFYNQSVASLIAINLPRTLAIVGIGVVLAHLISILLGSLQSYRKNSAFDHITMVLAYFFYSMPTFWLGIILIVVFSISLGWFPSGGISNATESAAGFGVWASHIALPITTIVIGTVAGWGRYMRASMNEILIQDYIRTARAKGLGEFVVVFKHALRNSLLPLITLFGLSLPSLFGGALYVEVVFNYPGLGLLFWDGAVQRDYPIILGGIVVIGALTIIGNLVADVLYAVVDPRIQY